LRIKLKKVPIKNNAKKREANIIEIELIKKTLEMMYLRRKLKEEVPQWKIAIIFYLTSTLFIGQAVSSSDISSNINSESYATNHRKVPSSGSVVHGSGGGIMEKQHRSSYAVISQAFSETVNSEFGSEYFVE
jgi:hypothetical protein